MRLLKSSSVRPPNNIAAELSEKSLFFPQSSGGVTAAKRCRARRAMGTRELSLLFLPENHVPVILVGFGNRFLAFPPTIAGRFAGRLLAALSLGALGLRRRLFLWSGVIFDFLVVAGHHLYLS